jgi:hypothetical protein
MEDADHQQSMPCDEVESHVESTAVAVSELFREHNRVLVGYFRSRLLQKHRVGPIAFKIPNPGQYGAAVQASLIRN